MGWIVALLIALIVAFTVAQLLRTSKTSGPDTHSYQKLGALFSPAERSFFGVLNLAVGNDVVVFGKVRVADVIAPQKGMKRSEWQRAFNKISGKHFDFVLCKKDDLSVLCVIELDDGSHHSRRRAARDSFLESACRSAGIPLARFPARSAYNVDDVRKSLEALVPRVVSSISNTPNDTAGIDTSERSPSGVKLCPKCSSVMVKKVARKGRHAGKEFWACSAFPACRYIEPVDAQ